MLSVIRTKHMKKILWALVIIIIFAFGLGGTSYLLRGSKNNNIGTINGKRLTASRLNHYVNMAKLHLILKGTGQEKITPRDIEILAVDFMVLTDKAKKDKIRVSDSEVIEYITTNLFPKAGFNQEAYQRLVKFISQRFNLPLTSRLFEEYVREFITVDKLLAKYIKTDVSESEIRVAYELETKTDDLTEFDEADYLKNKDSYLIRLREEKRVRQSIDFLIGLKQSARLNIQIPQAPKKK